MSYRARPTRPSAGPLRPSNRTSLPRTSMAKLYDYAFVVVVGSLAFLALLVVMIFAAL